ncbi:MAG: type II secretion system protein N, partial [Burkholderiaceae bacterium]
MIGRRRKGPRWAHTASATGWGEATFADIAWDKSRGAATRWAVFGIVVGVLAGGVAFAPAAWL